MGQQLAQPALDRAARFRGVDAEVAGAAFGLAMDGEFRQGQQVLLVPQHLDAGIEVEAAALQPFAHRREPGGSDRRGAAAACRKDAVFDDALDVEHHARQAEGAQQVAMTRIVPRAGAPPTEVVLQDAIFQGHGSSGLSRASSLGRYAAASSSRRSSAIRSARVSSSAWASQVWRLRIRIRFSTAAGSLQSSG